MNELTSPKHLTALLLAGISIYTMVGALLILTSSSIELNILLRVLIAGSYLLITFPSSFLAWTVMNAE